MPLALDHGARIADGDVRRAALIVGPLDGLPGLAAVAAAAEHQVDVAGVAGARLAALAEGQQGVLAAQDDGGDAAGVIASAAALENVDLPGSLFGRGNRMHVGHGRQNDPQEDAKGRS